MHRAIDFSAEAPSAASGIPRGERWGRPLLVNIARSLQHLHRTAVARHTRCAVQRLAFRFRTPRSFYSYIKPFLDWLASVRAERFGSTRREHLCMRALTQGALMMDGRTVTDCRMEGWMGVFTMILGRVGGVGACPGLCLEAYNLLNTYICVENFQIQEIAVNF